MTRGQRIFRTRKLQGMTQKELEDVSGVAQRLISELEHDKRPNISAAILERLADALGVSLDYLQKGGDTYDGDVRPAGVVLIGVTTTPVGLTDHEL